MVLWTLLHLPKADLDEPVHMYIGGSYTYTKDEVSILIVTTGLLIEALPICDNVICKSHS